MTPIEVMYNACVELKYADRSIISICCETVEEMYADNIYPWTKLESLTYNDPLNYATITLNGVSEYT